MWKSQIDEFVKDLPPTLPKGKLLSVKFSSELQVPEELFERSSMFPQIFFTFGQNEIFCFGSVAEFSTNTTEMILTQISTSISNYEISGLLHRPIAIGGQAFDQNPVLIGKYWKNVPRSLYVIPEIQIVSSLDKPYFIVNVILKEIVTKEQISNKLEITVAAMMADDVSQPLVSSNESIVEDKLELDISKWERMLAKAHKQFDDNVLRKIVLSRYQMKVHDKSFIDLVKSLRKQNEQCYRFFIRFTPSQTFISVTPELLFKINHNKFQTMALAGTSKREVVNSINKQMKTQFLLDTKELLEHQIVVDNIIKQLAGFVDNLQYPSTPRIKELNTIQHLETPIAGDLREGKNPFDILKVLHPTPAVGGQPKSDALIQIRKIEPYDRGWYAGTFGILSSIEHAIFVVSIRSAFLLGNNAVLYSGAGIVPGSNTKNEWDETELKFQGIKSVLGVD